MSVATTTDAVSQGFGSWEAMLLLSNFKDSSGEMRKQFEYCIERITVLIAEGAPEAEIARPELIGGAKERAIIQQ